jgi:hypothetical protein
MLDPAMTRIYFSDELANADDPVLSSRTRKAAHVDRYREQSTVRRIPLRYPHAGRG